MSRRRKVQTRKPEPKVRAMVLVPLGHPVLSSVAYEGIPSPDMRHLGQRLVATARARNGLAVAAPQVGKPVRLVGLASGLIVLNPTFTQTGTDQSTEVEGCLSYPGRWWTVTRPANGIVTGVDPTDGIPLAIEVDGIEARCWGHEIDHLDGILIGEPGRWTEVTDA